MIASGYPVDPSVHCALRHQDQALLSAMKRTTKHFAVCIDNKGNEASLILGKVYRVLPDAQACGGLIFSGMLRRLTRMRVHVDDRPRIESTRTSLAAR